jgi:hypothetical protein
MDPADLIGSRGADGKGVKLPTSTYANPGPTTNIRGIEPNTGLHDASNFAEPETTQTFGSEVPRGTPFDTGDSSGKLASGPGDHPWTSPDSSAANSHPAVLLPDSFTEIGESYPANGGLDGES